MSLTIKILQVLYGDAITLKYIGDDGKNHNIFIDGGFAGTYAQTIKRAAQEIISNGEKIDLFIITHIDQDHIGGVLQFIKEFGETDLVNEYWFNYGKVPFNPAMRGKISYSQGMTLRDFLLKKNKLAASPVHTGSEPITLFGARLTILSPFIEDLAEFETKWGNAEKQMISAQSDDYKHTIEVLSTNPFKEDQRIENKTSISFIFEYKESTLLFLADSFPSTIVNSLRKMGVSENDKLKVDYVKLSHHTSRYNTSPDLLALVQANNFIISANGRNRDYFPHKETLARILKQPEREGGDEQKVHFIFNYDNQEIRSIFEENDLSTYNFDCCYPKKGENGYTIKL